MTTVLESGVSSNEVENLPALAIEIGGMTARYGRTVATRDLSLHVPYGAVYGLVGPSGAGKTTVLRVLATLLRPQSGSVHVDGIDVLADPVGARVRTGYLPDGAGVYEALTVREYLDFYGALQGVPPRLRGQSTDELMELVGLAEERNRPVRELSRGMRQQLLLARCLIHNPRVLLLDEPAAGLDPRSRHDLRDTLQELARIGTAILISSHNLSELAEVCTHVGFVRSGALVTEGAVDEIMSAVAPESRLRLRLLERRDREALRELLEANPSCHPVEGGDELELSAWFSGTRRDLAAIHGQLCAARVSVTELVLEEQTLDDVFLRLSEVESQP